MKKEIHPKNYRPVVFKDLASDFEMISGSTAKTDKTMKWKDGKEYPLYEVEISSGSHPFYTGTEMIVDTAGRVERFEQKRKAALAKQETKPKTKEEKKQDIKEVFEKKESVSLEDLKEETTKEDVVEEPKEETTKEVKEDVVEEPKEAKENK